MADLRRLIIFNLLAGIFLLYIMLGVIMGVFIVLAMAQGFRSPVGSIFKMLRDLLSFFAFDIGSSLVNRQVAGVGFRRAGNVNRRLRQRDARLGKPDKFRDLHCCVR